MIISLRGRARAACTRVLDWQCSAKPSEPGRSRHGTAAVVVAAAAAATVLLRCGLCTKHGLDAVGTSIDDHIRMQMTC